MRTHPELSAFDRLGIAIVSLLGLCIGLLMASSSDVRITPTLVIIVPGLLIGFAVVRSLGITGAAIACGMANAVLYGVLLYSWYRLADALRKRIPHWFGSVGLRLSRVLSRRLH